MCEDLENELDIIFKEHSIESFHAGSQQHLSDTKNDGGLHFQTVHDRDFVGRSHPNVIDTEWVHAIFIYGFCKVISILAKNLLNIFISLRGVSCVATFSKQLSW